MATEKQTLKLDLDNADFVAKAKESAALMSKIASVENIAEVAAAFRGMLPALAAVTAAVFVLKKAIDFTLEGENIRQINAQFDALAKSVGLASDELKDQIMATTKGLLDEEDALQSASAAIVSLGENANRLPEIFELARKAGALFGGDITQRVEQISSALASGNARMLRQLGIIVDNDKALKAYAKAIGVTVDMLTDQQRKQAIMNEALEQGRKKFESVPEGIKPLTKALQQLKVLVVDIGEAFILLVEKTIGPTLVTLTKGLGDFAKSANLFLKEKLGDATESAAASIDRLVFRHEKLKEKIQELEEAQAKFGKGDPYLANQRAAEIDRLKASLSGLTEEIKKAGAGERIEPKPEGAAPAVTPTLSGMTKEQTAELAEHRMGLITQMRAIEYEAAQGTLREEDERTAYIYAIRQEAQAKIDALNAQGPEKVKNLATQELLIRKQAEDKIVALTKASANAQKQTYMDLLNKMGAAQAGVTVGLVAGFKNLAKGGKEAAQAMKAAFLNMLADRAEGEGAMKIAEGIWPPNPLALASGAALLALSGVLRSAAGGGGGSIGAVAGAGPGSGGMPVVVNQGMAPMTTDTRPELTQSRQRAVTVAIQGNYFETEQTRRALLEMIRAETDATSFQYIQIPQGTA